MTDGCAAQRALGIGRGNGFGEKALNGAAAAGRPLHSMARTAAAGNPEKQSRITFP
jgi:hypothetical protein